MAENFSQEKFNQAQIYLPKFYQAIEARIPNVYKVISMEAKIDDTIEGYEKSIMTSNDFFNRVDAIMVTDTGEISNLQFKVRFKNNIYMALKDIWNINSQRIILGQFPNPEVQDLYHMLDLGTADYYCFYIKETDKVLFLRSDFLNYLSRNKTFWQTGEIKKYKNKYYLVFEDINSLENIYRSGFEYLTYGVMN